jgi:hypothetical protein
MFHKLQACLSKYVCELRNFLIVYPVLSTFTVLLNEVCHNRKIYRSTRLYSFFANFENQRRNIQEQDLQALEDKTVSLSLVQGV